MMTHSSSAAARLALATLVALTAGTALAQPHKHHVPAERNMAAYYSDRIESDAAKPPQPAPAPQSNFPRAVEGGP